MDGFNSPIQGYGGWNVNQSYMTPSYMANFRPAYGNDGARENPFARNYSIGESISLIGPKDYSYGADALSETSAHMYNITTGIGDFTSSALQQVAIPAAAWYGVSKFDKFMGRGSSAMGGASSRMASRASRMATGALGRGAGAIGLGGLARAGGGLAGGLASGAGLVGGFAGSVFLPIMAAQAVASASDTLFMDPYVHTRRGMDAMRANTANQFVSGAGQTETGGFGMSATRAQAISQALTEAGQADFSLTGGTYNEIADNMMRAGIFQEVGDMDTNKIVDGVKKATSVLKLISRVTGDPDILSGISALATLKAGGLDDINKMEAAVHRIRQASGASGVSMDQLMDTVGNQGQVMAQQQGLRGVTGMLASVDAFAGFTNARRAGIISGGQMQALGGAEGMTQSLMQGAYQTMNSGYGRMLMQGRSDIGTGYLGTLSNFSASMAGDPIRMQGDWYSNQGAYKENMMANNTPDRIMLESLKAQARSMGLNENDGMVIMAMAESQGIDPISARSMAEADRARQNPLAHLRMGEARLTSNRSDYASMLQQEGLGLRGIPVVGAAQEMWKQGSREVLRSGAEFMSPVTETLAGMSDWWEGTMAGAKGLITDPEQSFLVNSGKSSFEAKFEGYELRGPVMRGQVTIEHSKLVKSDSQDSRIAKLNSLLTNGKPAVRAKAQRALLALTQGNTAEFLKLYKELDSESKGYLSGSTSKYRQQSDYEDVEKLIDTGELQATKVSTALTKVDRNLATKLSEAMRSSNPAEEIDKLIDSRPADDIELLRTLDVNPDDLSNLSPAKRKMVLADKAMQWKNRDIADIEGTNDEQLKQFYKLYQQEGFSKEQINDYLISTQRERDSVVEDLNPYFGNAKKAFQEHAAGIQNEIERRAREDSTTKSSEVDWSNLRDITDGIGKLGPAVVGNTDALNENTRALAANIEVMSDGKQKYTPYSDKANPLVNSVKNSVVRDLLY